MRYRKKPVVIEAYRTDAELDVATPEGTMRAGIGDYIITGVRGERYPCKPDIFDETYEAAEPAPGKVPDENARLRRLVRLLRTCNRYCGMCGFCPLMQYDFEHDGGRCDVRDEIEALERGLGIEVD